MFGKEGRCLGRRGGGGSKSFAYLQVKYLSVRFHSPASFGCPVASLASAVPAGCVKPMPRGLVTLLLAFQPVAVARLAECDNVAQLSDLKGEIYAIGGANASQPCGWHIYPGRRLLHMQFWVNESRLRGNDKLTFYSHKHEHPNAIIGIFSAARPVPVEMELRGSDEVLIVFSAIEKGSVLRMRYEAFVGKEIKIFGLYLSPIAFVMCVVLVGFLCCAFCTLPFGFVCWRRLSRERERTIEASELVQHAEIMRRRLAERAEREERDEAVEARTAEELAKLPTHQWSEGPRAADADEECCLCMEAFAGEDEVLLLPCGHYFHKPCIDRWFVTKRYVPIASTAVVSMAIGSM